MLVMCCCVWLMMVLLFGLLMARFLSSLPCFVLCPLIDFVVWVVAAWRGGVRATHFLNF